MAPRPESFAYARRLHPALDASPGAFVREVTRDRAEGDTAALKGICHLGQRTAACIGEPLPRVKGRVIHCLAGLQVHQQHGGPGPLGNRDDHGRGHIRRKKTNDEVAACRFQAFCSSTCIDGVGDEADVDDLHVELSEPGRDGRR